jgi:hypothetical protein
MMMRQERRREARGYGGGPPTRDRGVSFALAWRSRYSKGELLHGGESKTHVDVAVAEFLAVNNGYNMPCLFRGGT